MITFYDIHSTTSTKAWNLNTWKVRYILNYKSLPYKTEFIEYPDIEEVTKNLGVRPTSVKADGSLLYTLPAIHDTKTGKAMADSFVIAQYLDDTYPETPAVVVKGMEMLTIAFVDTFTEIFYPYFRCLLRNLTEILSPRSTEYISQRFPSNIWDELLNLTKDEQMDSLNKIRDELGRVNGWFNSRVEKGIFTMGCQPTFVDFAIAGVFVCIRIRLGEDSKEWKEIGKWHGGRWARIVDGLREWEDMN
ncbi:hypothetical protein BDQ17DRAFT_1249612 [Cyathus striatus]|nr:hypothetical protein BDQ17DRAFT_1249612 [Cyathus striatus]